MRAPRPNSVVMRGAFFLFAITFVAAGAVAQTIEPRETIIAYANVISIEEGSGYGAAFRHLWSPHLATQISVGSERHDLRATSFFIFPNPGPPDFVRVTSIDLEAQYQYLNATRFKPYLGAGVRHVNGPRDRSDRMSAEITGGLIFVVSPHFGIWVDSKALLRDRSVNWDPAFKTNAGLALRF
jgi:hypothetical protein